MKNPDYGPVECTELVMILRSGTVTTSTVLLSNFIFVKTLRFEKSGLG